jgi:predicted aldo/keto reductase-like oxidoreductase
MIGLENFWNHWARARKHLFIVVCGSAASWMINEHIKILGGLQNRITKELEKEPFILSEVEEYLLSRAHMRTRCQTVQLHMVTGVFRFTLIVKKN